MSTTTPTLGSDLSAFSDADLTKATDRAYREAARSWADYRTSPSGDVGRMLLTSAESADEWFDMLRDEQALRDSVIVEVRSSDVYVIPTTSSWVTRAVENGIGAKARGQVAAARKGAKVTK